MISRLFPLFAAALFAAGCCKSKAGGDEAAGSGSSSVSSVAAPIALSPAIVTDKDPGYLMARYARGGNIKLKMNPDMTVDLAWKGPAGARIQAGDVSAAIDSNGVGTTKLPLTAPMFKALASWKHRGKSYDKVLIDIPISVTATGPGSATQDKSLVLGGDKVLGWYLEQTVMAGKPALAPGEDASGGGKGYFLYYPDKRNLYLKHGDGRFNDAKLVVISDYLGAERKTCGTYVGEKTGKKTATSISLVSRSLTVYNRRTGKQLGKRTFKGTGRCPATMKKSYKVYHPNADAMEAFVVRFL